MTTALLIHGAYQGGWIWTLVAEALQRRGFKVLAPTLEGCAERQHQLRPGISTETHADEIVALLYYHDLRDVVLAGTSSAGMVMARVAEMARERIGRLAFVDALVLMPGERIRDIVPRPAKVNTAVGLGPDRDDAETRLLQELEPGLRRWTAERFTLHPRAVFEQPVVLDSFWDRDWNAATVYCRRAANPGEAHIRRQADKLGARWHELDTGHYPMLTLPEDVARIIAEG